MIRIDQDLVLLIIKEKLVELRWLIIGAIGVVVAVGYVLFKML